MKRKPDYAHRWTDEQLAALEKRIAAVYKEAADELQEKVDAYFDRFKLRDAEQLKLLQAGQITRQEYEQWRLAQIGRGKRFEALRDRMAERMTNANITAAAYINDATPGIYSLNRNFTAYTIEKQLGASIAFNLWDEQTVKRLIVERPDLMPYYPPERAVRRGVDLAWGKRQITAQVTQGILQGESIKHLADRLQKNIPTMERNSAIRAARTAVTGAQNAGRQDSYTQAAKMGIKVRKRWIATKDNRTRHDHGITDGQVVDYDKPFDVGGHDLMFPGDPHGPGHEIYNCRCTMRTVEKEGIEAEPRKMRVQTREYTQALEAEQRERARYERALEKEEREQDPEKKKALTEKRKQLQKSVSELEKKRRNTEKYAIVDEMTFAEWQEWVKRRGG